jgi:hypothetical protein
MWHSGIDQHKRDSVITTYGPEGPRVKQTRVPNTPLALQQYCAQFPGPHQAVVESTGSWYWLADVLALMLRAGFLPEAHMIRPEQRGPRDLMRSRLRLVEKCVSAQNTIARLLEKFNVRTVAELDELYQAASCARRDGTTTSP